MANEQDYRRDLAEIRSLMERSSKFLSLSGWAGVMAGIYALLGAYFAHSFLKFNPAGYGYTTAPAGTDVLPLTLVAAAVLILSVGTAVYLSYRRALKLKEPFWNGGTRRMLQLMGLPLVAGGLLLLVLVANGLLGLLAPLSLIFYGISLYNAGHFSYRELQYLGIIQVALGLAAAALLPYSLLIWALGFGLMHIVYGIYIYTRHQQ